MYRPVLFAVIGCLFLASTGDAATFVEFSTAEGGRPALLCKPEGAGPFPAVIYNHGSVVDGHGVQEAARLGYDLEGFCEALAKEGFLAFLPIREPVPMGRGFMSYKEEYKDVVSRAVDHVKTRPEVNPSWVAMMGFSMGGLTSFIAAAERDDLKALVLLAPAAGRGRLAQALGGVPSLKAPVLLLVEKGDARPILRGVMMLEESLKTHGKQARVIRYDRGGGHQLFWKVDYYWGEVVSFLREKLR